MDIKLYKLKVIKGKEQVAEEWLEFLKASHKQAEMTLEQEKVYLEAYFSAIENEVMYIYLFIAAKLVSYANKIARGSKNEVDKKHFEYMQNCIDIEKCGFMDCLLYFDNTKDIGKY